MISHELIHDLLLVESPTAKVKVLDKDGTVHRVVEVRVERGERPSVGGTIWFLVEAED